MLCAVGMVAVVAGCATPQPVTVTAGKLCGPWKQINIRPGDQITDRTATEIEANNLAREAAGCKYVPPTKTKTATS